MGIAVVQSVENVAILLSGSLIHVFLTIKVAIIRCVKRCWCQVAPMAVSIKPSFRKKNLAWRNDFKWRSTNSNTTWLVTRLPQIVYSLVWVLWEEGRVEHEVCVYVCVWGGMTKFFRHCDVSAWVYWLSSCFGVYCIYIYIYISIACNGPCALSCIEKWHKKVYIIIIIIHLGVMSDADIRPYQLYSYFSQKPRCIFLQVHNLIVH